MITANQSSAARLVKTVQGALPHESLGLTDAHNHLWIEAVPGADPGAPVLNQFDLILKELTEYRDKGGESLMDCQPEGCGRDGKRLLALSEASRVHLIACTGFHRRKYYPPNHWLWNATPERIFDFVCSELEKGLLETLETVAPVKAGFIKIALESTWSECFHTGMEGIGSAAAKSNALLEIHTEKGALAEKAYIYFTNLGLLPSQLVFCHMDKRPDRSLHQELARRGVLLEYDTFFRPKYNPFQNLWPLIESMIGAGFADRIAFATDMAEADFYHAIAGGPGLASLPGKIQEELIKRGIPETARKQLLGGNIARRLAGI
jgi:predicted metal-dependent phosphotriesterase family hydrolase